MKPYEKEMFKAIEFTHPWSEWVTLPQVRIGTGYDKTFGGDRTVDALALNMFPSRKHEVVAYEFKRTISDFRKDMGNPLKQAMVHLFCNKFIYVVPEGLWNQHDSYIMNKLHPLGDGLCFYRDGMLFPQIIAKRRNKAPFTEGLICSLVRKAYEKGVSRE